MSKIMIVQGIDLFFQILIWIIIIRLLLSWFPNINWYDQPFRSLKEFTDPMLEPFRRIIPPIGGIDISPIGLFLAIYIIRYTVLIGISIL